MHNILVVEHSGHWQEVIRELLKETHANTCCVEMVDSLDEANESMTTLARPYDLYIIDLHLHEARNDYLGVVLLEQLRLEGSLSPTIILCEENDITNGLREKYPNHGIIVRDMVEFESGQFSKNFRKSVDRALFSFRTNISKILFLSANPRDTVSLRVDAEVRSIDEALQSFHSRNRLQIVHHGAVRISDLQVLLLRHQPNIVHLSAHGDFSGEIILEDPGGNEHVPVPQEALSDLFALFSDTVQCVVLSACYSDRQAEAVSRHVGCVIGFADKISDDAAKFFSTAFYLALAYGKSVQTAFDLGHNQIELVFPEESGSPVLYATDCDPEAVFFGEDIGPVKRVIDYLRSIWVG